MHTPSASPSPQARPQVAPPPRPPPHPTPPTRPQAPPTPEAKSAPWHARSPPPCPPLRPGTPWAWPLHLGIIHGRCCQPRSMQHHASGQAAPMNPNVSFAQPAAQACCRQGARCTGCPSHNAACRAIHDQTVRDVPGRWRGGGGKPVAMGSVKAPLHHDTGFSPMPAWSNGMEHSRGATPGRPQPQRTRHGPCWLGRQQ